MRVDGSDVSRTVGWVLSIAAFAVVVAVIVVAGVAVNRDPVEVGAAPEVRRVASPMTPADSSEGAGTADRVGLRDGVRGVMDRMAGNPALGDLNALVADAATGEDLWGRGEDVAVTPASSMKVLTAAAALLELDHGKTVETRVLRYPGEDAVVLVGGGDTTLSRDGAGFYPGAASIRDLAREVRDSLGVPDGAAVGTVYVDASLFRDTFHPSWDRANVAAGFIAPVEPVMVDGARLSLDREDAPRTPAPAEGAGRALADELGAAKVEVLADGAPAASGDAQPEVVGSVESAPLVDRVRQMMTASDNVLAEALAREVAVARGVEPTFAGAAQAVRDTLGEHGLALSGSGDGTAVLADSSGLSSDNRVSPRQLGTVLTAAARPIDALPEHDAGRGTSARLRPLLDSLPVAGVSGTLTDRYSGSGGAGWVRAKTGTLDGTSALAGYVVTEGGETLTFVLLSNDAQLLPARAAADAIATQLRGLD